MDKLVAGGETPEMAEQIAQGLWAKYLPNAPLRLIDANSPSFICQLQSKGHVVLGLTARYPGEAFYTHPQLERLGFSFDRRFPDHALSLCAPAIFEKGVLFASALNTKGQALEALLQQLNLKPKKIIFVDDKIHHVENVQAASAQLDLDFLGIRYSSADKRVHAFDAQIAELQMQLFPRFVSDEEAFQMLVPAVN